MAVAGESQAKALPADVDPLARHVWSVLDSDTFRRAQVMRQLLQYLWDNKDRDISEYAVATEALGRSRDFDPRVDASVRVQVARLRNKLEQYYLREGRNAELRITIPVGTHRPVVVQKQQGSAPARQWLGLPLWGQVILGFMTLLLAGACLFLLVDRRAVVIRAVPTAQSLSPLPAFWRQFVGAGNRCSWCFRRRHSWSGN